VSDFISLLVTFMFKKI